MGLIQGSLQGGVDLIEAKHESVGHRHARKHGGSLGSGIRFEESAGVFLVAWRGRGNKERAWALALGPSDTAGGEGVDIEGNIYEELR